ncbi:hypothetical protein GCM10025871_32220 [Deinococcus metallilatus]|nr:hypothetical protein GCM10025871_32220 [Deinococcus metallilatus]
MTPKGAPDTAQAHPLAEGIENLLPGHFTALRVWRLDGNDDHTRHQYVRVPFFAFPFLTVWLRWQAGHSGIPSFHHLPAATTRTFSASQLCKALRSDFQVYKSTFRSPYPSRLSSLPE